MSDQIREKLQEVNRLLEGAGLQPVTSKTKPGTKLEVLLAIAEDRLETIQAKQSKGSTVQAHISFDPGNRSTIATADGVNYVLFRSCYAELSGTKQPNILSKDSEVIRICSSDAQPNLEDHRYYFGNGAIGQRNYTVVFEGELKKIENSLYSLLPCVYRLYPEAEDIELSINVNVTDPRRDLPTLKNKLLGTTEYEVEGKVQRVHIHTINAYNEGLGPWKKAKESGLVSDNPRTYTGVINLGGSTAEALLITSEGLVLTDASFSSDKLGTYELAYLIKEELVAQGLVKGIRLDIIMDALELGRYDLPQGVSIEGIYQDCIDKWFDTLLSKITDAWSPQLDSVGLFIMTGGSVNLIKDRLEGQDYWFITPNCILDNCLGIWDIK